MPSTATAESTRAKHSIKPLNCSVGSSVWKFRCAGSLLGRPETLPADPWHLQHTSTTTCLSTLYRALSPSSLLSLMRVPCLADECHVVYGRATDVSQNRYEAFIDPAELCCAKCHIQMRKPLVCFGTSSRLFRSQERSAADDS